MNTTVEYYRALIAQAREGHLMLENIDLDTGAPSHLGEYSLADETQAELVDRLGDDRSSENGPDGELHG